jgi:hypothetical protein
LPCRSPCRAGPLAVQYPSIIRAHNLCYSTIVLDDACGDVEGVEYYEVVTGLGTFRFAQQPRGVVPALLEDLAQFRKRAKADMAAAKAAGDAWSAALANSKQLAYKITMNSVYGFLGATKGMLPMVPIAASVTATGRAMIQQTKDLVERMVPGSRVIYGDTDSVMVIFELGEARRHDMQAHFDVATRVAADISKTFRPPNELEFEKTYFPYMLFSKKRYAGEYFFCGPIHLSPRLTMNSLARFLSLLLLVILVDAVAGFGAYRKLVHAATGAYCAVTNRNSFERYDCTTRIYYSRHLWGLISIVVGLSSGYVTMQALKSGRW